MLDKLKDLWKLKSQMEEVKKSLDAMSIEVESPDKKVKIVISGSQEIKSVKISGGADNAETARLEIAVKEAVNAAVKEAQKTAARKMSEISGLNLPGL